MTTIIKAKKVLIGKMVGLDGQELHAQHKVLNVSREIIEFDGEKDNNFKIELDGSESYFIHSCSIDDLLNGQDVGAYIKNSYKGGTIQLINKS